MKLTGKCKDEFKKWLVAKEHSSFVFLFEGKSETIQNAYIIEWFDSVGIYIGIFPKQYKDYVFEVFINEEIRSVWSNRPEATAKAIEKGNEIFNLKN